MNAYEALNAGVSPYPIRNLLAISREQFHRVLKQVIIRPDGCWEWMGGINPRGYGRVYVAGVSNSQMLAHRLVYMLLVGSVPDGHDLHHQPTCLKRCVNPEHVQPLPHPEHSVISNLGVKRGSATHCQRGHEFTEKSAWRYGKGRRCKACSYLKAAERRASRRTPRRDTSQCKWGHAVAPGNIRIYKVRGRDYRGCLECHRAAVRRYQTKRRAEGQVGA